MQMQPEILFFKIWKKTNSSIVWMLSGLHVQSVIIYISMPLCDFFFASKNYYAQQTAFLYYVFGDSIFFDFAFIL